MLRAASRALPRGLRALPRQRTAPLASLPRAFHAASAARPQSCDHRAHGSYEPATMAAGLGAAGLFASAFLAREEARADAGITVEDQTGVSFAGSLGARELIGVGPRLMGGIVRVYALGVYGSSTALRSHLSAHIGRDAGALTEDPEFWEIVCETVEPVLRFVVVREVAGKHMQTGFERGLRKALRAGESAKAIRAFSKLFVRLGTMKVGSEVFISFEGDVVSVTVDGRDAGQVDDPSLRKVLMRMFLGEKCVTPGVKQSVAEGLAKVLVDIDG